MAAAAAVLSQPMNTDVTTSLEVLAQSSELVAGQQATRWHTIIESLAGPKHFGAEEIKSMLCEAATAAQADDAWCNSGMLELLNRARDSAMAGFVDSARKAAVGLLDFHLVVQKYKKSPSAGAKTSGASSDQVDDASTHSPRSPQALDSPRTDTSDADNMTELQLERAGSMTGADDTTSGRKRRRSIADALPAEGDTSAVMLLATEPVRVWSGPLKLEKGNSTVDMCSVDMLVPASVLEELPSALRVSAVRPRRSVLTKGQIACETALKGASRQQMAQLRKMANMELVAMMPLEDCGAILVPYLGKDGTVKAVTFLAALD